MNVHSAVVQLLSRVWLFATSWTAAGQACLSLTISWSSTKFMSIEMVMPSNHLILCHPLSPSWKKVLVAQSCPSLCDFMDCSLSGSSVHRILQARILEWVAIPFSRGSSRPRDRTQVFSIVGRFFTVWATRKAPDYQFPWSGKNPHASELLSWWATTIEFMCSNSWSPYALESVLCNERSQHNGKPMHLHCN